MTQPISSFTASTQIPPAATRTADSPGEATQESEAVRKWKASGLKLLPYSQKLGSELESLRARYDQKNEERSSIYSDLSNTQTALENCDVEETTLLTSFKVEEIKNITTTYKQTLRDLCYEVAVQRACLNKYPYRLVGLRQEMPETRTIKFNGEIYTVNGKTIEINGKTYKVNEIIIYGFTINDQTFVIEGIIRQVPGALPHLETCDLIKFKCESPAIKNLEDLAKALNCFSPLPLDADLSTREAEWKTLNHYASTGHRVTSLQLVDGKKLYEVESQIVIDFQREYWNLVSKLDKKISILMENFLKASQTQMAVIDLDKKLKALGKKRDALRSQLQDRQRVYSTLRSEQLELASQIETLSSEHLEIIQMSKSTLQTLQTLIRKARAEKAQAQQTQ